MKLLNREVNQVRLYTYTDVTCDLVRSVQRFDGDEFGI